MQSRVSCFNKTLFLKNLRNYMPLWAVFTIILLVMLPVAASNQMEWREGDSLRYFIITNASVAGCLINLVYAVCVAMAQNFYLYNLRSAGMLHALPLSRGTHFVTNLASGLSFGLVPNIIAFCVAVLVCSASDANCGLALAQWLAIMCMSYVFYFGFATLCAQLTSNIVVLPVLYLVLNLTVFVVELIVTYIMTELVYGLNLPGDTLHFLSPPVQLLQADVRYESAAYEGWTYLVCLVAAGLVCLVGAWLLYRRRQLETAGDVVAVRVLKPVFKYCFTFGCALVLGMIICAVAFGSISEAPLLAVSMLVGGFIGYFGAQMMLKKTVRVFRRGWVGFAVCAVVILGGVFGLEYDLFGIESFVPDAEDVQFVKMNGCGSDEVTDPEAFAEDVIELQRAILADPVDYNDSIPYDSYTWSYVGIEYQLKSGTTVTRTYNILISTQELNTPGSPAAIYNSIISDVEYIYATKLPNMDVSKYDIGYAYVSWWNKDQTYSSSNLSSDEAFKAYACVCADVDARRLGGEDYRLDEEDSDDWTGYYELHLEFTLPGGETYYSSFRITPEAEETWAYLTGLSESW